MFFGFSRSVFALHVAWWVWQVCELLSRIVLDVPQEITPLHIHQMSATVCVYLQDLTTFSSPMARKVLVSTISTVLLSATNFIAGTQFPAYQDMLHAIHALTISIRSFKVTAAALSIVPPVSQFAEAALASSEVVVVSPPSPSTSTSTSLSASAPISSLETSSSYAISAISSLTAPLVSFSSRDDQAPASRSTFVTPRSDDSTERPSVPPLARPEPASVDPMKNALVIENYGTHF
jgi:hypothetical protein